MRLLPTSHVVDGTYLGADVHTGDPSGIPLLRRGVALTVSRRDRLAAAGVHAVYVEDSISQGIEPTPLVDDDTRSVATRAVAGAFQSIRRALDRDEPLAARSVVGLEDVVSKILDRLDACGPLAPLALADLASADAYTFQHSIDVAATGMLVARRYWTLHGWCDHRGDRRRDDIETRLFDLGMGLLLHDIGKLGIPLSVLHKPGRLTPAEWELMRCHPRMGLDLLEGEQWSPLIKGVVLRHHERWNGSGYPDGRVGDDTHEMARIAAVADTFDAITSERPYAAARSAAVGVEIIRDGSGTLFDARIVDAFCQVVAPYPTGSEIPLPDGSHGIVVSLEDGAFHSPLVRSLDGHERRIDLSLPPSDRVSASTGSLGRTA